MSTVTPSNDYVDIRPEVQNSRILSPSQVTEYELKSMEEQNRRLKYFTDTTNEEIQQGQELELFINLSLVKLFSKLSQTIIALINELVEVNQNTSFNDFVYIFVKDDRLIYLGILLIMISLAIYLINITN
jgi:hypothetical protein